MLKNVRPIWLVIAGIILFRLVTLSLYPLMDSTEARYGEIARIMIETNNWVTPQFDYNVPFWGKPPLHTWASAAFGKVMGISEFSLRLPHLLSSLVTLFVLGLFARRLNLSVPLVVLISCSTVGIFVASGMIMTDSLLLMSMTMAMVGFAIAWRDGSSAYAYLGFIGIGLGLLAKGPIILILLGLAIVPWIVFNYGFLKGLKELFSRIPLVSGLLLTCLIALPWYIMAERATPGFLNYFLVGEHFLRFVQSGWQGDLYGSAHSRPRGIIWIYWIIIAFPWSFYLAAKLFSKESRATLKKQSDTDNLTSYFVFWLISPMLLFTMSGNILPIYVLPGIPAIAFLIARMAPKGNMTVMLTSLITPIAMLVYMLVALPSLSNNKSDKALLADTEQQYPLYYLGERSFSGRFYSQGKAKLIDSLDDIKNVQGPFYLAVNHYIKLDSLWAKRCDMIAQNHKRHLMLCSN